jgi:hypothetical protein
VIDAQDISGTVTIDAPNVVIRRSKIHGTGTWGVFVRSGSVKIYDTELWGFENAIGMDNWEAYRVNIHSVTGDATKLGNNVTLQDSWIHDFTPAAGAHADGGQIQNGVSNVLVRHNHIDGGTGNSALFIAPDLGPSAPGPVVVDNNLMGSGNYTVYCVDGNNGQYFIKSITFTNNRFKRNFRYGHAYTNVPLTQSGNVWDDTGAALTL